MEWEPIETAPKYGGHIKLLVKSDGFLQHHDPKPVNNASWNRFWGWVRHTKHGVEPAIECGQIATHWQNI